METNSTFLRLRLVPLQQDNQLRQHHQQEGEGKTFRQV